MNRFAQVVLIFLLGAIATAQRGTTRPLEIWVVDVEGGKAALYLTPTGQTAIIDTGFPEPGISIGSWPQSTPRE